MRSNFNLLLAGILVGGPILLTACQSTLPISAYPPQAGGSRSVVCNFDQPVTLGTGPVTVAYDQVNANLFQVSNPPGYGLQSPGAVTLVQNFSTYTGGVLSIVPGANNTSQAMNLTGTVNDPGTGVYPTLDLQVQMEGGNLYDAGFFSGIKFYLKLGSADQATKRVFSTVLFKTQEPPAGGCVPPGCYDHFFVSYNDAPKDEWKFYAIEFSSMGREGWGQAIEPPNLTGPNLSQILWFMWQEGRNNAQGLSTVDLSVDEIELF